jgi:hypothetical protein
MPIFITSFILPTRKSRSISGVHSGYSASQVRPPRVDPKRRYWFARDHRFATTHSLPVDRTRHGKF